MKFLIILKIAIVVATLAGESLAAEYCPTCGRRIPRAQVRAQVRAAYAAQANAQAAANYAAYQQQVQAQQQFQQQAAFAPAPLYTPASQQFPGLPTAPPPVTTQTTTVQKFEYRWVPVP